MSANAFLATSIAYRVKSSRGHIGVRSSRLCSRHVYAEGRPTTQRRFGTILFQCVSPSRSSESILLRRAFLGGDVRSQESVRPLVLSDHIVCAASARVEDRMPFQAPFEQWMKKNDLPSQKAKLVDAGDEGFGLVTTTDVKEDDVILRIPGSIVLNHETALSSEIGDTLSELSEWSALALFILYEKYQNPKSKWKPYIKMWPETLDSTICWPQAELDKLFRGSPVLLNTKKRIQAIESEYERLKAGVMADNPDLFREDIYSLEAFKWAFGTLLSRFTFLPTSETLSLVPLGDMMNHDPNADLAMDYDVDTASVILVADKDYKKGEVLRVSYGQLSNAELMLNYGFALNNNPYDRVDMTVALGFDALAPQKAKILERFGFSTIQTFPVFADRMPEAVYSYQRLAKLKDPDELEQVGEKIMQNPMEVISVNNEYDALQSLLELNNLSLREYGTGVEDELALQKNPNLPYRELMASILRGGEMLILSNTVMAVRKKLLPIRGLQVQQQADPDEIFGGWAIATKLWGPGTALGEKKEKGRK
mmetsp:Transcript_32491/g.52634  ORF Transcript_32491/g.52634 Transcript_32491/m.52634 type:complete len:537 (+) Transcript_32491:31-1641(+)